jgi:two-component system sensor histidine kinase/response regulator
MTDNKPRILIVEDHPLIAELVETRLRVEGMRPVHCSGGREALALLEQEQFDLVVLDIMMPEIDGYDVLERIRSQPTTATLPVIFLSAKSSPADIEKGFSLGANHYITKPLSGQDLVRKIRMCLAERPTHSSAG